MKWCQVTYILRRLSCWKLIIFIVINCEYITTHTRIKVIDLTALLNTKHPINYSHVFSQIGVVTSYRDPTIDEVMVDYLEFSFWVFLDKGSLNWRRFLFCVYINILVTLYIMDCSFLSVRDRGLVSNSPYISSSFHVEYYSYIYVVSFN